jgi:hypothetical protein
VHNVNTGASKEWVGSWTDPQEKMLKSLDSDSEDDLEVFNEKRIIKKELAKGIVTMKLSNFEFKILTSNDPSKDTMKKMFGKGNDAFGDFTLEGILEAEKFSMKKNYTKNIELL